jgi:hypothetical protein
MPVARISALRLLFPEKSALNEGECDANHIVSLGFSS